jgi:hypothetical protein
MYSMMKHATAPQARPYSLQGGGGVARGSLLSPAALAALVVADCLGLAGGYQTRCTCCAWLHGLDQRACWCGWLHATPGRAWRACIAAHAAWAHVSRVAVYTLASYRSGVMPSDMSISLVSVSCRCATGQLRAQQGAISCKRDSSSPRRTRWSAPR